jgi:hypothetical protein
MGYILGWMGRNNSYSFIDLKKPPEKLIQQTIPE